MVAGEDGVRQLTIEVNSRYHQFLGDRPTIEMNTNLINRSVAVWLLVLVSALYVSAQGTGRDQCFNFDKLSPELRKTSEELLLRAMDHAVLYTLAGGIKPMSSGFAPYKQISTSLPSVDGTEAEAIVADLGKKEKTSLTSEEKMKLAQAESAVERAKTLKELEDLRTILKYWRCGDEIFADLHHYSQSNNGKRSLDIVVFSKPALQNTIRNKQDFFSRWGITPSANPFEVIYAIEVERSTARNAGYGYLFGYPDHAVEFFVKASDSENMTGHFVKREFLSIPTVLHPKNAFVYAVPVGHQTNSADIAIKEKAAPIFAEYTKRREEYIGDGKKGIVALVRDWFCGENGQCTPSQPKNSSSAGK